MKPVVLALIIACAVGSALAEDCLAKVGDIHQCMEDSLKKDHDERKAKLDAIKAKIQECYIANKCTPPAKGNGSSESHEAPGNNSAAAQCRKAYHDAKLGKMDECIKKTFPTFTPPKDGMHNGEHRQWDHKDDDKDLDACPQKQAVRDCKRDLWNSTHPTDAERKAIFQAHCDAKKKCFASVSADCQTQLEALKKTRCDCHSQIDQQRSQIRSNVTECANVPDKKGEHKHAIMACDKKDYCKLGYQAFARDRSKQKGKLVHYVYPVSLVRILAFPWG